MILNSELDYEFKTKFWLRFLSLFNLDCLSLTCFPSLYYNYSYYPVLLKAPMFCKFARLVPLPTFIVLLVIMGIKDN
jgi:hypothetical protein